MSATRRQRHHSDGVPRHSPVRTIINVAVVSRVATITLMILANAILPTHDAGGVHKFRPRTFPVPAGPVGGGGGGGISCGVFSAFTRWDSAWFLSIADSGYPQSSAPSRGGKPGSDIGDGVDCRGTARAWGGEEYEVDRGVYTSTGWEAGAAEEQHGTRDGYWGREGRMLTEDERPRCRPDVPLEEQAHAFFPLYPWLVRWAAAALRALLLPGGFVLGRANSLVLAAVLISNSCFVAAAVLLYRLGAVVTGDSLLAHRGALAFCVTPASVFFSTAYTESLYAALSFAGLLVLFSEGRRRSRATRKALASESEVQAATGDYDFGPARCGGVSGGSGSHCWWGGAVNAWIAAALLSLATLARSNGIAGAGVLVLEKLRWMAGDVGLFHQSTYESNGVAVQASRPASPPAAAQSSCRMPGEGTGAADAPRSSEGGDSGDIAIVAAAAAAAAGWNRNSSRGNHVVSWLGLASSLVATALQALLILAPYVLVQAYAYRKFCLAATEEAEGTDSSFNRQGGEAIGGAGATTEEELMRLAIERIHPWCAWKVPSVYTHIQSAYWGVGALRYYEWKQVPNFLLAAPALVLTAYGTARFFSAQLKFIPTAGSVASTRTTGGCKKEDGVMAGSKSSLGRRTGASDGAARLNFGTTTRLGETWLKRLAAVFFSAPELPHPGSTPLERTGAAALIAQWAFLASFAAVCMNVQVVTRFLAAACPPLHWWTASLLVRTRDGGVRGGNGHGVVAAVAGVRGSSAATVRTCLRWYLGLYFVLGAVMHSNFLPWT
ncbi:unnamed protein product [Hapterophycus canaliculatus]